MNPRTSFCANGAEVTTTLADIKKTGCLYIFTELRIGNYQPPPSETQSLLKINHLFPKHLTMQLEQFQSFASREEAGRKLAQRLAKYSISGNTIVLALPNGGVPVGAEIAEFLDKPFDVLLVEKIIAPGDSGAHLGAVTGGGVRMLNSAMIDHLQLSKPEVNSAVLDGSMRLAHREKRCRGQKAAIEIADRTVILIDDGTAPCEVIRAAVRLLRRQHADRVIVALPVACQDIVSDLRMEADHVVTLVEPKHTGVTGNWFDHFPMTTDADVCRLLADHYSDVGLAN